MTGRGFTPRPVLAADYADYADLIRVIREIRGLRFLAKGYTEERWSIREIRGCGSLGG